MDDILDRLRSNAQLPICPFEKMSPEYWKTPDDQPCKFCGGLPDGPNKCTGADMRIIGEAANEIERLRARLEKAEAELVLADAGLSESLAIRSITGDTYEVMIMFDSLKGAQNFHQFIADRCKTIRALKDKDTPHDPLDPR